MHNEHIDVVGYLIGLVGATLGLELFPPEKQREVDSLVRLQWGGQEVYIKKNDVDAEARSVAIRAKFNGRNRVELQTEYGIGRTQFYRIIKGS